MTVKLTVEWWKANKPKTLPTGPLESALKDWEGLAYIVESSTMSATVQSAIEALDKVEKQVGILKKLCLPKVHNTTKANLIAMEGLIEKARPGLDKRLEEVKEQEQATDAKHRAEVKELVKKQKQEGEDEDNQAADAKYHLSQHQHAIEQHFEAAKKLAKQAETTAALSPQPKFMAQTLRLVEKMASDLEALSQQSRAEVTPEIEKLGGPGGQKNSGYQQALAIIKKQTEIVNLVVSAKGHLAEFKKKAEAATAS
jgi:hypothetical protein